jgi:hypothetical protein
MKILRGKEVEKIAQACNRYPVMNLSFEIVG